MPPKRLGRPPKFAHGRDGKPISGLSFNKANETYYATYSDPRVYFGKDFDRALIDFRAWTSRQTGMTVTMVDPNKMVHLKCVSTGETITYPRRHIIPEDVFYAKLREVLSDPIKRKRAAEATNYPLDRLESLPLPQPSPTLQSLIDLYTDKAKITVDWRRKSKQYWSEFMASIKVKTVRDIAQQSIADYHDTILESNQSQTYVKHRFGGIKRIFNFARQRGIAPAEMRTVLDYCAILQAPKSNGNDPHPISVSDFARLLNAANEKWTALLLASLNFCMYAVEIARVTKAEIDLERKTLVTQREKTTVTRVAVMWDRTVEAIKRLPKTNHTHVFLSREGCPHDAEGLRTAFRKLRGKAGLPETVKFSDIRDGAYTAAIEGGADLLHSKLLAGHETGISDAYVRRNPTMVQDACRAIERHYFGEVAVAVAHASDRPFADGWAFL